MLHADLSSYLSLGVRFGLPLPVAKLQEQGCVDVRVVAFDFTVKMHK